MKLNTAVDAGSCYIKIIEGCEKKGKLFIRRIGSFANPFTCIRENLVEREQDVFVKSLKSFLKKNSIGSSACISSVSGMGTIIHYFDIPNLPQDEIRPTVNLELMQVTQGGTKNLDYDYLLLPSKNKRNTVLFIGYPKDKCEFYTNSLQRAGLKPLVMDHDSFAILNAFRFIHRDYKKETLFILNIGSRKSNFALQETGGFILIRDIPFGGTNITEIIADRKKISFDVAEIYKNKKENQEEVRKIISEDMEDFLNEVSTGIEYFKVKTEKFPDTLFLTGGASLIPGITDSFSQFLKIDVKVWNPVEELPQKTVLPEDIRKNGVNFSVAIGLILRKIQ